MSGRSGTDAYRDVLARLDDLYALRTEVAQRIAVLEQRGRLILARAGKPEETRIRATRAACGTDSGYYRHLRGLNEPACEACKKAHSLATREREARRVQASRTVTELTGRRRPKPVVNDSPAGWAGADEQQSTVG